MTTVYTAHIISMIPGYGEFVRHGGFTTEQAARDWAEETHPASPVEITKHTKSLR